MPDYHKLTIYEALAILHRKPDLNRQIDNFVNPLKLFSRSTHITNIITDPLQNMNIINYNYTNLTTLSTPQPSTSLIPHSYRYPTRNSDHLITNLALTLDLSHLITPSYLNYPYFHTLYTCFTLNKFLGIFLNLLIKFILFLGYINLTQYNQT